MPTQPFLPSSSPSPQAPCRHPHGTCTPGYRPRSSCSRGAGPLVGCENRGPHITRPRVLALTSTSLPTRATPYHEYSALLAVAGRLTHVSLLHVSCSRLVKSATFLWNARLLPSLASTLRQAQLTGASRPRLNIKALTPLTRRHGPLSSLRDSAIRPVPGRRPPLRGPSWPEPASRPP